MEGLPPVVFGQGLQERDFTYVKDLVRLHNLCITNDEASGKVFNVSTGKATTIKQLAETVYQLDANIGNIVFEDVKPGQRSQIVEENRLRLPSELQQMVLDSSLAQKTLGWKPEVDLKEGIKFEFEWLKKHPEYWLKMSY